MVGMRTAIVSDLHLGVTSGADLLRHEPMRKLLFESLAGADRLILLGDIIELRDQPIAAALREAEPFFRELAGVGGVSEVVLIPGNHDHRMLGHWLDRPDAGATAGLEEVVAIPHPAAAQIGEWLGEKGLRICYPGIWVRDDVYATHGHYLDSHLTLPTIERLGIAAIDRLRSDVRGKRGSTADYEQVHAPLYDLLFNLAQGARAGSTWSRNSGPTNRMWELLGGASGRARTLRGRVLASAAVPAALKALERGGVGRFGRDFSLAEVGRAGVTAMHEVVRSLEIDAEHVIFGHIHRRGPHHDDRGGAADPPWSRPGAHLWNPGCWVYAASMISTVEPGSAFWPGSVLFVEDDGPPVLVPLLDEKRHAALRGPLGTPGRPGGA